MGYADKSQYNTQEVTCPESWRDMWGEEGRVVRAPTFALVGVVGTTPPGRWYLAHRSYAIMKLSILLENARTELACTA